MRQQGKKSAGKYGESGLPVPGSSQLKSFGTWQMTDDICMQIQPWPSTIDMRDWMIKTGSSQSVSFDKWKQGFFLMICATYLAIHSISYSPMARNAIAKILSIHENEERCEEKKWIRKHLTFGDKKNWIRKHLKFESSFETACKESSKGCDNWCK